MRRAHSTPTRAKGQIDFYFKGPNPSNIAFIGFFPSRRTLKPDYYTVTHGHFGSKSAIPGAFLDTHPDLGFFMPWAEELV
jgi:hypothetical protein